MNDTLDEMVSLALFAHVVGAGSFTEAALRLRLSKSVVSARVAKLEERIGARLLHRTTRRLSLTETGSSLYERAVRMVAAADDAVQSVAGVSREPRGRLRVNAPVGLAQAQLGAALADFLPQHPAVTVDLVAADRIVNIVEEGFDLAIRIQITRLKDSSLVTRKIASDDLVLCAAPSYLERAGTPRRPADLVGHDCLRYSTVPTGAEWRFKGPAGSYVVPVRGSLVSSDGGVLRAAAIGGLGVTVLPRFMVRADLTAGRLRPLLEQEKLREIGIFAVYPHRRAPAHLRAFVDFLADRFAGRRWSTPV